jgi:hypothetical protein
VKKLVEYEREIAKIESGNMFYPILKEFINPNHELVILTKQIDRNEFENGFCELNFRAG